MTNIEKKTFWAKVNYHYILDVFYCIFRRGIGKKQQYEPIITIFWYDECFLSKDFNGQNKNWQKLKTWWFWVKINDLCRFPTLKHIWNDQRYDNQPLFLENSFLIFYCFLKTVTSFAAKSRRVGDKRMSDLGSAAKKQKKIILVNCVFQKKFSVTQCYL